MWLIAMLFSLAVFGLMSLFAPAITGLLIIVSVVIAAKAMIGSYLR